MHDEVSAFRCIDQLLHCYLPVRRIVNLLGQRHDVVRCILEGHKRLALGRDRIDEGTRPWHSAIAHRRDRRLVPVKVRPDIGGSLAADLAHAPRFEIGEPDMIRPLVRADRNRAAAVIVRAIDQDAAHAGLAHLGERDLSRAVGRHAPLKRGRAAITIRYSSWPVATRAHMIGGWLALFIGIQTLFMTGQPDVARAAIAFPNATELTVKEIGKDRLSVEHQFGPILRGGLSHRCLEVAEHLALELRANLIRAENFERKVIGGVHRARFGIEFEKTEIVHDRLQFSGGFPVVFKTIREFRRQQQNIRAFGWSIVDRLPAKHFLQVGFNNEREDLSALRVHEGFGADLGGGSGIYGGGDSVFSVADLMESDYHQADGSEKQSGGRGEQKLSVVGEIARQFHKLSIGFLLFYFAGKLFLGFFGWKYLYDDGRILGSSFLLSGVLLACL